MSATRLTFLDKNVVCNLYNKALAVDYVYRYDHKGSAIWLKSDRNEAEGRNGVSPQELLHYTLGSDTLADGNKSTRPALVFSRQPALK